MTPGNRFLAGTAIVLAAQLCSGPLRAEVLEASDTHYRLAHEGVSALAPAALWERLVHPERWWQAAHSYSGDAANLSLTPEAGGLWTETWDGGSVAHGRVLLAQPGKLLRLEAPFGPLQGLGAYVVWTITLEASADGSRVRFEEVASAPVGSGLNRLASAVDGVKGEALASLTAP